MWTRTIPRGGLRTRAVLALVALAVGVLVGARSVSGSADTGDAAPTVSSTGTSSATALVLGAPVELAVHATGANGEGRIETPRRGIRVPEGETSTEDLCADGAQRAYWNYDYGADLPAGSFSNLGAELRMHLALHSVEVRTPGIGPLETPAGPTAFLLGDASYVSLIDPRGTLKIALRSGSCTDPTLSFDGTTAAGAGTWEVVRGDGAYRQAAGSGTFTVTADVAPGADNPFSIQLDGDVSVLEPTLEVEVVDTSWRGLGTDYLSRRPTVVLRVTNTGPGDAFDARIAEISSPTPGASVLGALRDRPLGDLRAGESEVLGTRFQLGLLQPCDLVILGCAFTTATEVRWTDALGTADSPSRHRRATAPDLPPPL